MVSSRNHSRQTITVVDVQLGMIMLSEMHPRHLLNVAAAMAFSRQALKSQPSCAACPRSRTTCPAPMNRSIPMIMKIPGEMRLGLLDQDEPEDCAPRGHRV